MVPMDQPKVALQMMSDFVPWMIQRQWLSAMGTLFSNMGGQGPFMTLLMDHKEGQFTYTIYDI